MLYICVKFTINNFYNVQRYAIIIKIGNKPSRILKGF